MSLPLHEALRRLTRAFGAAGLAEPGADAALLLEAATGLSRVALLAGGERPLSERAAADLTRLAARRLAREPVHRILGRRAFWTFDLTVTPAVLDPRPDTETLVETALALAAPRHPARVLDLGTGSGALLCALLGEWPDAVGIGVDRSVEACRVARCNVEACGFGARALIVAGDWGAGLAGPFDVVVSNPPYVASDAIPGLDPEVRDHDPALALDGGPDGLDAYRVIAPLAARLLVPGGLLALEVGWTQAAEVAALLTRAGFADVARRRDLGGHERVVSGRLDPAGIGEDRAGPVLNEVSSWRSHPALGRRRGRPDRHGAEAARDDGSGRVEARQEPSEAMAEAKRPRLAAILPPRYVPGPLIDGQPALDAALARLRAADPALVEHLIAVGGPPPLRLRPPGFAGLAAIVTGQQLSTASAAAIFGRLEAQVVPLEAAPLLAMPETALRTLGLSIGKVATLRRLADAVVSGALRLEGLGTVTAEEAHAALVAFKGIGPWTADSFLLFCLGHPDAWPAGDLALQEAVRIAMALDGRPSGVAMQRLGERWRPHRGVAARLLWAYYRAVKQGRGGMLLSQPLEDRT